MRSRECSAPCLERMRLVIRGDNKVAISLTKTDDKNSRSSLWIQYWCASVRHISHFLTPGFGLLDSQGAFLFGGYMPTEEFDEGAFILDLAEINAKIDEECKYRLDLITHAATTNDSVLMDAVHQEIEMVLRNHDKVKAELDIERGITK